MRYKTAKVGDLDIFYREAGPTDAPTVLLLHGPSDIAFTPAVKAIQAARGSRPSYARMEKGRGWHQVHLALVTCFSPTVQPLPGLAYLATRDHISSELARRAMTRVRFMPLKLKFSAVTSARKATLSTKSSGVPSMQQSAANSI